MIGYGFLLISVILIIATLIVSAKTRKQANEGKQRKSSGTLSQNTIDMLKDEKGIYYQGEAFDSDIEKLEHDIEKLEKENKIWEMKFSFVCSKRENATILEKNGENLNALKIYLENIDFCENKATKLNYNNYAHDINRAIILYSKTNQHEVLKGFLSKLITRYKNEKECQDWIKRLSKLQ
ncbi:MAG: hypothetical protein A2X18_07460 [Bacteroidetes bacterium GWF2_40_14]|nr:MAG: hypothetical protein A2X18_07460 [Bacteroidetes bacterium GWF2_40_14]